MAADKPMPGSSVVAAPTDKPVPSAAPPAPAEKPSPSVAASPASTDKPARPAPAPAAAGGSAPARRRAKAPLDPATAAKVERKREREKRMVSEMIALYCKKRHGGSKAPGVEGGLCPACAELDAYARLRSEKCPFMETKTFCSNCRVHCYKPEMRERIREVMRFSGPRMMFHHPVAAIRHVVETRAEKRRLEKEI